jgi:hypothetical protein
MGREVRISCKIDVTLAPATPAKDRLPSFEEPSWFSFANNAEL